MSRYSTIASYLFLLLFALVTFWACSGKAKRLSRLKDFPNQEWQSDQDGCKGIRKGLKDQILSVKHLMRGFKMSQIEMLLGKPDAEELSERGQRYYIYFIGTGPACQSTTDSAPSALYVRFSAIGLATEFIVKPFKSKQ